MKSTGQWAPEVHWSLEASAEECDADRYEEQLCVLPPAWMAGNRFAVGEPATHLADGTAIYPVCFKIDEKYYWGRLPIRAIKHLDDDALKRIASGNFVVRDGKNCGYVFKDGECIARFYGDLVSDDGLGLSVHSGCGKVIAAKAILKDKFDIVYFMAWNESDWEPVEQHCDVV